MNKLALLAAAPAIALAAPALAQTNAEFAATTVILSAVGDVQAAPDRANLSLGVNVEAPTAAEAMKRNAAQMAAVVAAVKARGVPDRAIRTQGLNLQTQYVYAQGQPARLTGYRAMNTVSVTVEDLDRVGALLDAAVAAGANQVDGISFSLKNAEAAMDQARAQAIKALKAKAEVYAQANGLKVARLVRMSEGGGFAPPQPLAQVAFAARAATPISAGELDVRIEVNAIYELVR